MEIKVGQYVRTKYNKIFKVDESYKHSYDNWENKETCMEYNIIKVANTAQELIQEDDLVELFNFATKKRFKVIITGFRTHHIETHYLEYDLHMFTITKIYTPNKDKSVYTEQWESDK